MSKCEDKLVARVRGVNAANAYGVQLYPLLREVFEPLVGVQVCKKDGGLLGRVSKLLPVFPNKREMRVYHSKGDYSLEFGVQTCESCGSTCVYYEVSVYVGRLTDGVLMELCEPFTGRTDWTPDEVIVKREAYGGAMRAADLIKSTLFPFGEYDH